MNIDLSLVPIEELLKEAESRCSCLVVAYELLKDKEKWTEFRYVKGQWFEAVRLSAVLSNDILNNWNGELKTLQRINKDDKDE